ncbi:hypothetical protein ABZV77_37835 [Streptomyces sp. NPDC004732]
MSGPPPPPLSGKRRRTGTTLRRLPYLLIAPAALTCGAYDEAL